MIWNIIGWYFIICLVGVVFMIIAAIGFTLYEEVTSKIKKKREYKKWLLTGDKINVSESGNVPVQTTYYFPKKEIREYNLCSKSIPKYFAKKYLKKFKENGIETEIKERLKDVGIHGAIYKSAFFGAKGYSQIVISCVVPENMNKYEPFNNKPLTQSNIEDIVWILENIKEEYPELDFKKC